ncbi:MAG: gamma-glutamyl-gamma-aminobutyrate hydrolase family protein [Gemmatimonadota bacterium]|nr:gamma-glutamyl-gamma-aminobutyrate hydrolase family protein [Gemmatimonadota bacterium]
MPRSALIGVTASTELLRGRLRVRVNAAYTRAVERAGAIPVVIPPLEAVSTASVVLRGLDGLVLTGGEDIDPSLYDEPPHPALGPINSQRDATEIALVEAARESGRPTLAICRGIQLLNVALGGSLVQDISAQRPESLDHDQSAHREARVHAVQVEAGSLLGAALGTEHLTVNSSHHQALDRVGDGLRISARAPDGVIEGVEWSERGWWAVGVQWHPEELMSTDESWDRSLFAALVERAEARGREPAAHQEIRRQRLSS